MRNKCVAIALSLLVGACATPQNLPVATYPPGSGQWGEVGLVVNDGQVVAHQVGVPLATKIKQQIEKAGYFSRIKVNSIYVPQQLRVQFTAKNRASDEVAAGKLIAGAATLFLLPMEHEIDFVASFSMECRGAIVGAWEYAERVAQTQFLLIEPDSAETNVVESTVSRFIRDAAESGKLKGDCQ